MKLKFCSVLLLSLVSILASSVTLVWDQSPEPNVTSYKVYRSVNSGGYVATSVAFPTHQITYGDIAAGNSYTFYATAVNGELLESGPSSSVSFTPDPPAPAINVTRVTPGGIAGVTWTGVAVVFDTVNLSLFKATNYTVAAVIGSTTNLITATNSPAIFPILPVGAYTFSAWIVNNSGQSPPGATKTLSGTPPVILQNVKVQIGP